MIPMTAEQLYRRRDTVQSVGTVQDHPGRPMFPKTTRPVIPAAPSNNWNYNEYHGFDGRGLNTYIIPPHQQRELALFSRYILKDPDAADTPMLERAQKQFLDRRDKPVANIKNYRNIMNNGGVLMNPSMTVGVGKQFV